MSHHNYLPISVHPFVCLYPLRTPVFRRLCSLLPHNSIQTAIQWHNLVNQKLGGYLTIKYLCSPPAYLCMTKNIVCKLGRIRLIWSLWKGIIVKQSTESIGGSFPAFFHFIKCPWMRYVQRIDFIMNPCLEDVHLGRETIVEFGNQFLASLKATILRNALILLVQPPSTWSRSASFLEIKLFWRMTSFSSTTHRSKPWSEFFPRALRFNWFGTMLEIEFSVGAFQIQNQKFIIPITNYPLH